MRPSYTVPIAILIGGMIIAFAVYTTVRGDAVPTTPGKGNLSLVRPVGSSDHILGNPLAPVQIIVYSDFECNYCRDFHQAMRVVIANAGVDGNVAWIYRPFPLTELYPNAFKHAQAAECVAEVGGNDAFWKFADSLFANQPVDPREYGSLAQAAGVSGNAFATCYSAVPREIDTRITANRQNALDIGAVGTPFSVLLSPNKPPMIMDGAYTAAAIELLIEQALQN